MDDTEIGRLNTNIRCNYARARIEGLLGAFEFEKLNKLRNHVTPAPSLEGNRARTMPPNLLPNCEEKGVK
jgi:hypothetical protein